MALTGIFTKAVTILCVVVILIAGLARHSEAAFQDPERTVRMTNVLGDGLDLTVHCKQRGEDLGVHLLHPNESYEFTFKPNFWGTNQYFCTFSWPGACHWFDIFILRRDHAECITCVWQIRKDKPCRLGRKSHVFDDCFDWNPTSC